jgi:protein-tyrosine phosphatase
MLAPCFRLLLPLGLAMTSSAALAIDNAVVTRKDAQNLVISWQNSDPVSVFVATSPAAAPEAATPLASDQRGGSLTIPATGNERRYFILRDGGDGSLLRLAERVLPLEQGSNFRDVGGYVGADGKRVKWGRIYRSGAMPLLTEADYAKLGRLGLGSIVDLRSTDERLIAPDQLDDRTGALFLSNDYSLATLLGRMKDGDGENSYRGMGKTLAPQYRAVFRRLLADEGAVMYHCSAGPRWCLPRWGWTARRSSPTITSPPHCAARNSKCRRSIPPTFPAIRLCRSMPRKPRRPADPRPSRSKAPKASRTWFSFLK